MNSKLNKLTSDASQRLQATQQARSVADAHKRRQKQDAETDRFKQSVERAFGIDVFDAIGPVKFEGSMPAEMHFEQADYKFILEQVTGDLVNFYIDAGPDSDPETILQFNLNNADSKDRFLDALGKVLRA